MITRPEDTEQASRGDWNRTVLHQTKEGSRHKDAGHSERNSGIPAGYEPYTGLCHG